MFRKLLLITLILSSRVTIAADAFSIMSWNVEWLFDDNSDDNYSDLAREMTAPSRKDWDWRRDQVAAAIAEVNPTVAAMQEVEGRRVLWYLSRALSRNHKLDYHEYALEGTDHFTEQDVGLLVTSPAEVTSLTLGQQTTAMRKNDAFFNATKHLIAVVEVPVGKSTQKIVIVNLHLRAGPDAARLRVRQANIINAWLKDLFPAQADPVSLIVLGDLNTEEVAGRNAPSSEISILMGRGTPDQRDDLVDVLERAPRDERGTHLLPDRQLDRILASRDLVEDQPGVIDLSLAGVRVRRDVCIREGIDNQQEHWERYWKMPADQRDLSDHYPVVATFQIR